MATITTEMEFDVWYDGFDTFGLELDGRVYSATLVELKTIKEEIKMALQERKAADY